MKVYFLLSFQWQTDGFIFVYETRTCITPDVFTNSLF